MTLVDIFLFLLLGVIALAISFFAILRNEIAGINRLLLWLRGQLDSFTVRGSATTSEKEKQVIQETLRVCEKLKKVSLEEWDFKSETFSLVEKIAFIYHPDARAPMEQARLGDVLEAVQEANQKVLNVIHLPRINYITQFRVIQIFESFNSSSDDNNSDREKNPGIWNRLLKPVLLIGQTRVVRSLLIQWMLLVGEAAIKIYGTNPEESDVEAEAILAEWDSLQDEPSLPLPENVEQIVSSSKKEILFSATSISWKRARQIYFSLADQIARHYHSDSPCPIYEVRVCDLLKSVADSLEGIGRLGQKPVLNKLLRVRVSQLTQARDLALPLGQNKILEWVNKYQVGLVAKWSHTLYKTLQKKQPGILLRDVVFGVVKEGGKRWLVLHLHRKIAIEANKLYGR
ncbi:MAG: hypothetical protein HOK41_00200 [Nitrospina sp.]|jgi:hypothetical protein|nr:hypothetical protein [Nitrospina sp.]MBT6718566.1 hypothetical protein [Nitrospina sp.]